MKEKVRFLFVDLLRGWALLVMIEVHVFNAMLIPSLKGAGWFGILNFINGLVAPSFLFISGFAFMLSTGPDKMTEMRKLGYAFWKKLGRIVLIFLAGYSLHLPILSLRRIMNYYSPDVILRIYNVDILQCIAAGLLLLLIFRMLIKSDKNFTALIISVFMASVFLSPFIWQTDFGKFLPVPLAAYFNNGYGSLFPLFPWLGFLFAGAISCNYFIGARNNNYEKKYINIVFIAGVFFLLAGSFFPSEIFSLKLGGLNPRPLFFIERLGYVLILLAACWYYVEIRKTGKSFVVDVGRESLLIYWLHLQIIYRRFYGDIGLANIFGQKLNAWECICFTFLLAVLMIITAKYWGTLKKKYRPLISKTTFALVSLLVLIFLAGF